MTKNSKASHAAVVNVVCMRWGTLYGVEYVNRLYSMVKRHLKRPFHFYCLTDDGAGVVSGVHVLPMPKVYVSPNDTVSGWRKLGVFSPKIGPIQGKVLFLDLDLVITGDIDDLFDHGAPPFCIIENWTQKGRHIGNSSVFLFEFGKYTHVLDAYMKDPEGVIRSYDNEQVFLSRQIGKDKLRFWPEPWCVSFKHTCLGSKWLRFFKKPALPESAKIVVFHGSPNPDEAVQGRWPKRFPPFMRRAEWIEQHWA